MDKEKAEKLLEDIRNLVNLTLPENDSLEERMALNEVGKKKLGLITEEDLNDIRTLLRAQSIFMGTQKREVLEYERKLQRHMDRMEKILDAFMLSVRRDWKNMKCVKDVNFMTPKEEIHEYKMNKNELFPMIVEL